MCTNFCVTAGRREEVLIFFNILPDRCNSPLNSEGAELQLTL